MKIVQIHNENTGIYFEEKPWWSNLIGKPKTASSINQNEHPTVGYQHEDALWFADEKHATYKPLAQTITNRFPNAKLILELGCGAGSLAYWIREENPELTVVTADANKVAASKSPFLQHDHHFCIRTDIEYQFETENGEVLKFDVIISFEHLEHIEHSKLNSFTENLLTHSKHGTTFIASAADGGHTSEHSLFPKDWWVDFFSKKGMNELNVPSILDERTRPFNCCNFGTHELIFEVQKNNTRRCL